MSEVQSRPAARGRSTARGGRGAHGSRGPRANTQTNGGLAPNDTSADEGELGELKRRYASQLTILKDMFVDWTDEDLVMAIEDSDGDIQATVEKITEGKRCIKNYFTYFVSLTSVQLLPLVLRLTFFFSR
jgi:hypothetical protein